MAASLLCSPRGRILVFSYSYQDTNPIIKGYLMVSSNLTYFPKTLPNAIISSIREFR
jgi:hypothetical protein